MWGFETNRSLRMVGVLWDVCVIPGTQVQKMMDCASEKLIFFTIFTRCRIHFPFVFWWSLIVSVVVLYQHWAIAVSEVNTSTLSLLSRSFKCWDIVFSLRWHSAFVGAKCILSHFSCVGRKALQNQEADLWGFFLQFPVFLSECLFLSVPNSHFPPMILWWGTLITAWQEALLIIWLF